MSQKQIKSSQTLTNKQINVIVTTSSVCIQRFHFIHIQGKVVLMAVQFITVESLFFLCKFIGLKNPLIRAHVAYFAFLGRSEKKWRSIL